MHRENTRLTHRTALRRIAHGGAEVSVDGSNRLVEQTAFSRRRAVRLFRRIDVRIVPTHQLADRDARRRAHTCERIRRERFTRRMHNRLRRR
jgi:hypothetical protein